MPDQNEPPPDTTRWLKRVFSAGNDQKIVAAARADGLLTEDQARAALDERDVKGVAVRDILVQRGWMEPEDLARLEAALRVEDFARPRISRKAALPAEVAVHLADDSRALDEYVLCAELGRGGSSSVWRAWDRVLDRWVAIKLGPVGTPQVEERFRREALAAARLRHANIVTIHHVGQHQGRAFIVMELVAGRSLAEARLALDRAVDVVATAAGALAHAHEHGVVHRDIKPGNIMLDDAGRVFLVDFGLVHVADSERLTVPGEVMGTAAYMSPEQAQGEARATDPATDIYSLGATLYEVATGRPPFAGQSFAAIIHKVVHADPAPPRRVNPGIGADWNA